MKPATSGANWEAALAARKWDPAKKPEKPVPVFRIGEQAILTVGNIMTLQGQAKAGKSAYFSALMGAILSPGVPVLGVMASPEPGAILHFDTEQSHYDWFMLVLRGMIRGKASAMPDWFHSYMLADLSLKTRREAVFGRIAQLAAAAPLKAVFLDGVADLIADPNDTNEAAGIVDEIHQTAIRCKTAIVCVIHENPSGSETGKTRGHLGSQLQRKAETNLRLVKDADGIVTVFSEVARNCHITKDKGPRFAWSDQMMMHIDVEPAVTTKSNHRVSSMKDFAEEIFRDAEPGGLGWREVIDRIVAMEGLSMAGARKRLEALSKAGVLLKNTRGLWVNKL